MEMEVSFEMKLVDLSCIQVGVLRVLKIDPWFYFGLKTPAKASKYHYIYHDQNNGLGRYPEILKSKPMSVSNYWKKEFLQIIFKLKDLSKYNVSD